MALEDTTFTLDDHQALLDLDQAAASFSADDLRARVVLDPHKAIWQGDD